MSAFPIYLFTSDPRDARADPRIGQRLSAERSAHAKRTDEPIDDRALLDRLRGDDEAAFVTIFETYWTPLCAYAWHLAHSRDIARDLVQDALVRVWEIRHTIEIQTSLRAYLYAAVRNRALHHAEHDRVTRQTEVVFTTLGTSPAMGETPNSSDDTAIQQEFAHALDIAIGALPPRTQQVARLKWSEGLGRTEIAEVLGVSPFTVDKQIGAAVRALRVALDHFLVDRPGQ